jgi:hypothetical protein
MGSAVDHCSARQHVSVPASKPAGWQAATAAAKRSGGPAAPAHRCRSWPGTGRACRAAPPACCRVCGAPPAHGAPPQTYTGGGRRRGGQTRERARGWGKGRVLGRPGRAMRNLLSAVHPAALPAAVHSPVGRRLWANVGPRVVSSKDGLLAGRPVGGAGPAMGCSAGQPHRQRGAAKVRRFLTSSRLGSPAAPPKKRGRP